MNESERDDTTLLIGHFHLLEYFDCIFLYLYIGHKIFEIPSRDGILHTVEPTKDIFKCRLPISGSP